MKVKRKCYFCNKVKYEKVSTKKEARKLKKIFKGENHVCVFCYFSPSISEEQLEGIGAL